MRRTAIITLTALSACSPCWADFTSPPWPHGTDYYTAGTNKDNRARQIYEGIEERERALGMTNAPTIVPAFYIYERSNCVQAKTWIAANAGQFVDLTRTTSSNVVRWALTNLIADCGLPTNYFAYTPWQQLNGVGNGYTNAYTAAGYTTLHYGYAGLTNLMKRLVAVTARGKWCPATNGALWGRAWSDSVGLYGYGGQRNDSYVSGVSSNYALAFRASRADSITEALAYEQVQWTGAATATYHPEYGEIYGKTNAAPEVQGAMLTVSNWWPSASTGHRATWYFLNPTLRSPLASPSISAGWRLYVKSALPPERMAGSQSTTLGYDDFGAGLSTNVLTVAQTGLVVLASAVESLPIAVTNALTPAQFPSESWPPMTYDAWTAAGDLILTDLAEFDGPPAAASAATVGFTVADWLYVIDYGVTNGFTRK